MPMAYNQNTTFFPRGLANYAKPSNSSSSINDFGNSHAYNSKTQKQIAKAAKAADKKAKRAAEVEADYSRAAAKRERERAAQRQKEDKKKREDEAKAYKAKLKRSREVVEKIDGDARRAASEEKAAQERAQRNEAIRKDHDRKYQKKREELLKENGEEGMGVYSEFELPTRDGTMRGERIGCQVKKENVLVRKFGKLRGLVKA